MGECCYQSF